MALTIREILRLYESRGAAQYGSEAVSQLEHALQCAALAEGARAAPPLVAACFLHDLGHLVAQEPHDAQREVDDVHQHLAIAFLRGTFPEPVLRAIRLHVDAKRYLCHVQPGYWDALSPASQHSLQLQGGTFTAAQAARFIAQPQAPDAVALRLWDDLAKVPGRAAWSLAAAAAVLHAAAL
jgi:phosphonate degradation associated HDIG domain protein